MMTWMFVVELLFFLIATVIIFWTSIIAHEFGHLFALLITKTKIVDSMFDIKKGISISYNIRGVSKKNRSIILLSGIIIGAAYIILMSTIISVWLLFLLIPYTIGCKKDIIALKSLYSRRRNK